MHAEMHKASEPDQLRMRTADSPDHLHLMFPDANIAPRNVEGTGPFFDTMYLKPDATFWMSLVDPFICQVCNLFTVDPRLNSSTPGNNAKPVPFAVVHVAVSSVVFGFR